MKDKNQKKEETKPLIHRVDKIIQSVGVHLAGKTSRRSFIGRVSAAAAFAGGASLLAKPTSAEASACTLPAGCFGTVDVNVCYSPWEVVASEPGQSGVVLRKGPSFSAAPVTKDDGVTTVVIPVGGIFGRCSNRTGGSGCPDPGPRANINGFLWGYYTAYAKQGWMPYSVSGVTYAVGDNGYTGTLCGPANFDFDCRDAKSACPSYHGCGGSGYGSATCSVTYRPIVAVGTNLSDQRYYLRYAPNSTTFFWLVPGDQIKRWGYVAGSPDNWSCVEVVCASYAPNGCRGWVDSTALGDPNGVDNPCYPALTCPSGS